MPSSSPDLETDLAYQQGKLVGEISRLNRGVDRLTNVCDRLGDHVQSLTLAMTQHAMGDARTVEAISEVRVQLAKGAGRVARKWSLVVGTLAAGLGELIRRIAQ